MFLQFQGFVSRTADTSLIQARFTARFPAWIIVFFSRALDDSRLARLAQAPSDGGASGPLKCMSNLQHARFGEMRPEDL